MSPFATSPRITRIPAAGSAVASSVMNGGMPVVSLLARSPGPCQTNQPSPIAGMIAATSGQADQQHLVVLAAASGAGS